LEHRIPGEIHRSIFAESNALLVEGAVQRRVTVSHAYDEAQGATIAGTPYRDQGTRSRAGAIGEGVRQHHRDGKRLRRRGRLDDHRGDRRHQPFSLSGSACEVRGMRAARIRFGQEAAVSQVAVRQPPSEQRLPPHGPHADIADRQRQSEGVFQEEDIGGKNKIPGAGVLAATTRERHLVHAEVQDGVSVVTLSTGRSCHSGSVRAQDYSSPCEAPFLLVFG